jgi:hypothetical protein
MPNKAVIDIISDLENKLKVKNFKSHKNFENFCTIGKRITHCLRCFAQLELPYQYLYDHKSPYYEGSQAYRINLEIAYIFYRYTHPPVFALTPELLNLFALTDLPKGLDSLQKPFKQAFFMLPKGYFIDYEGEEVDHCFVDLVVCETEYSLQNDGYLNFVFDTDTKFYVDFNTPVKIYAITIIYKNGKTWFHRFCLSKDGKILHPNKRDQGVIDLNAESCGIPFMDSFVNILMQAIFYLQIQPDADITNKEIQSNNAIGFGKKLTRKERQRNSMSDFIWLDLPENKKVHHRSNNSTVASTESTRDVSTHWRRGHWRNQPIGEKRQDSKLIWIRPSLINPVTSI